MSAIMHHGRKSQRRNLRYRRYERNRLQRIHDARTDRQFGPTTLLYMLRGKELVSTRRLIRWARWFEQADRHIGADTFGAVQVSTVFLGLDHNFSFFGAPQPQVFETMIFGGSLDGQQWRYATWDEARAGHLAAVEEARAAL
jgi:hypothetical protein